MALKFGINVRSIKISPLDTDNDQQQRQQQRQRRQQKEQQPGVNVIKLFTAVSSDFS